MDNSIMEDTFDKQATTQIIMNIRTNQTENRSSNAITAVEV
jgi:hypothetical protein